MSSQTTQKRRILTVLRSRGRQGVTGLEWAANPPDGGPPIADAAGVIRQLRDEGHGIETLPQRSGNGTRFGAYVLVRDAEVRTRARAEVTR